MRKQITKTCIVLFALLLCGCASTSEGTRESDAPRDSIEIVSLRQTAGGYLLDLRYRVLDPEQAAAVFDRQNDAYLIDEATGTTLGVPTTAKVGPLRQTNFKPDPERIYFILFSNPGVVTAGDKVTFVVGDYRAEHLVVE
ncbi:MAG: hypothetical protein Kow0099_15250 [Candidatus Abyssubacteria bacterium]